MELTRDGTLAGSIKFATEGVRKAQDAFKESIAPATSPTRCSSDGIQRQDPFVSAVRVSKTDTSNVKLANWNTREDGFINRVRLIAAELVEIARCSTTVPLGRPLNKIVSQVSQEHCRVVSGGGGELTCYHL